MFAIRPSPTHGRGAFATRTIRKGTRIVEYRGARIKWEVADKRAPTDPMDPYHTFLLDLGDGRVIDASQRGNTARWINHSCDPNCEVIEYDGGRVFVHARCTIRAGEELRYDYRLQYDGPMSARARRAFSCRCGAKRCRGTLLANGRSSRR
jgi:uncharacterized protein